MEKSGNIQSVDRALSILELFMQESAISLTDISNTLSLPKTTVFSLMATMERRGFLLQTQRKGKYELGLKVFQLSRAVFNRMNIIAEVAKLLTPLTLRHNHNAHISLLDGSHIVYLESIMPPDAIHVRKSIGSRSPAFSTASGKALLANLNPEEANRIIDEYTFKAFTKNTITDSAAFRKELDRIRKRGYSIDNQENIEGIMGVSVVITDNINQPALGISLSGLAQHFHKSIIQEYYEGLREVAVYIQLLSQTS